jgi:DNA-binding transcriptional regulator YdaS (Cro superfamily)
LGAVAEVHVRTLRRTVEIAGGEEELAILLKVTPSHLALWLRAVVEPPADVFLRAVDLISEHELARLSASQSAPAANERKEDLAAS